MSYAVATDEDRRDYEIENRRNAAVRHCRIGWVTQKPSRVGADAPDNHRVVIWTNMCMAAIWEWTLRESIQHLPQATR